jgi:hypothetical protein
VESYVLCGKVSFSVTLRLGARCVADDIGLERGKLTITEKENSGCI